MTKKILSYFTPFQWLVLLGLLLLLCVTLAIGTVLIVQNQGSPRSGVEAIAAEIPVANTSPPNTPIAIFTFPPTWTPKPTFTPIPTRRLRPTATDVPSSGLLYEPLPMLASSDANYPFVDPLDLKKRPHSYKGQYLSIPGYAFTVTEYPNGITTFNMQATSHWNYEVFAFVVALGRVPELHEDSLIAIAGTCMGYEGEFLDNGSMLPLIDLHYITVLN